MRSYQAVASESHGTGEAGPESSDRGTGEAGPESSASDQGRAVRDRKYIRPDIERAAMSDETIEAAVEAFLDDTESALDDYDQGYADADATLSVIRTHIDELAAAVETES